MANPLSQDIRERAIAVYEEGELTQREVALQFRIGEATMKRLVSLKRETNSLEPRPRKHGPAPTTTSKELAILKRILERHPDYTYEQLTEHWNQVLGGGSKHRSTTVRCVQKLGYTLKKKGSSHRSE
jgi:transposase